MVVVGVTDGEGCSVSQLKYASKSKGAQKLFCDVTDGVGGINVKKVESKSGHTELLYVGPKNIGVPSKSIDNDQQFWMEW